MGFIARLVVSLKKTTGMLLIAPRQQARNTNWCSGLTLEPPNFPTGKLMVGDKMSGFKLFNVTQPLWFYSFNYIQSLEQCTVDYLRRFIHEINGGPIQHQLVGRKTENITTRFEAIKLINANRSLKARRDESDRTIE